MTDPTCVRTVPGRRLIYAPVCPRISGDQFRSPKCISRRWQARGEGRDQKLVEKP